MDKMCTYLENSLHCSFDGRLRIVEQFDGKVLCTRHENRFARMKHNTQHFIDVIVQRANDRMMRVGSVVEMVEIDAACLTCHNPLNATKTHPVECSKILTRVS